MKNKFFSILILILLTTLVLYLTLLNAPSYGEKKLYSDQSVHIMGAMSIWHDFDLKYSLEDLTRFRSAIPAENGPRGLFLKKGLESEFYFAKPFLYAVAAAPFYGIFGINGFLILNTLCFFLISFIALKATQPHFGQWPGFFITVAFVFLSPFTAWVPIVHPDIFIAMLVTVGVGLLLSDYRKWTVLAGALIIGLAIYEKPTFVVVLPFLFLALSNLDLKQKLGLLVVILFGWFLPTSINIIQDGNILSYQGARFYVVDSPYPLESGWNAPIKSFTGHIFSVPSILQALAGNVLLLPEKIVDFFVGRQTGILLYFPVALALIIWNSSVGGKRSRWILAGMFCYLITNWLVFPTNGYGGSGSYGSRYLLQIIPLAILAVAVGDTENSISKSYSVDRILRGIIYLSIPFSVLMQFKVLPPTENFVSSPAIFLNSFPAKLYPFENSLLPTISLIMPKSFEDRFEMGDDYLYLVDQESIANNLFIKSNGTKRTKLVLYQLAEKKAPPPIQIRTSSIVNIDITKNGRSLWKGIAKPGTPAIVSLNKDVFNFSYFDLLDRRKIRWQSLDLILVSQDIQNPETKIQAEVKFYTDTRPKIFNSFGQKINPSEFYSNAITPYFAWGDVENWGIWTVGQYAELSFMVSDEINHLDMNFLLQAYLAKEHNEQRVDVYVNSKRMLVWHFFNEGQLEQKNLKINRGDWGGGQEVIIGFHIHKPEAPINIDAGTDSRMLGIGLHELVVEKK